ncbi:galactokinase [Spinactinospora alkalitolerans]|uniref:galactokinase n=1 Tax=Spinactinospora alkalitolerans TaxID=687207 RepID=UPI0028AF82D8|nr:galactokinase [Spinactinospora alkalitolerans]
MRLHDGPPARPEETAKQVAAAFEEAYGLQPAGVWRAPGRVNLIGEHTDYNDGLVLPMALPWGVSLALAPTDDGVVEARSAQRPGEPVRFAPAGLDARAPSVTGWAAYVAGVFWALREEGHLADDALGARILLDSDLPVGAALSSSAALECAVLLALVDALGLSGLAADQRAMVRLAQSAENRFVGAPTGILDQSASLRCKEGHALFLDCRSEGARNVPLPLEEAGLRLLIIDTRVEHKHTESGYGDRREECERAARALGVPALRDVEDLAGALQRLDDPVLRRRVQHVVTEIHRVNAVVGLLRAGRTAEIGAVFNGSHLSLRDQFEVSCPELDVAVDTAARKGARGARMTGGGFGGSAIALVAEDRLEAVCAGVAAAFAERRWKAPDFRVAVPAAGARRVDW